MNEQKYCKIYKSGNLTLRVSSPKQRSTPEEEKRMLAEFVCIFTEAGIRQQKQLNNIDN